MQAAGWSVCCGGSCLPAGQPLLPAPTLGTRLRAELCLSQHGEGVEVLGRWGLSFPVCMAVVRTDSRGVLCRACLISRLCFPIPTAGAFAARVEVGGTLYRVWGTPAREGG